MASSMGLIADIIGDFIHSKVWAAPIYTFIEANCATFDYDDEVTEEDDAAPSLSSSVEEQRNIHEKYQHLVDLLIEGLGTDLSLDLNELKQVCQLPTAADDSVIIDESYEQLYAARDFQLFQEMMRRKNLILQLQALVSLQLQWGLLKESDTGDDLVLSLLLQATASPSHRELVESSPEPIEERDERQKLPEREVEHRPDDDDDDDDDVVVPVERSAPTSHRKKESQPRKPPKKEYHLPDLRGKAGPDHDAEWYRNLQRRKAREVDNNDSTASNQPKKTSTPQTISAIPEEVLREKLRELNVRSTPAVDDDTADARKVRHEFLEEQRRKIAEKKRAERTLELEKETQQPARIARPQSARIAHTAMTTMNENKQKEEQQTQNPNDELIQRRRALADKIKREVVDRR